MLVVANKRTAVRRGEARKALGLAAGAIRGIDLPAGDSDAEHLAVKLGADARKIGVGAKRHLALKVRRPRAVPAVGDDVQRPAGLGRERDAVEP